MKNTITREAMVQELIRLGYDAEAVETTKNGVVFEGITIRGEGEFAPVIYTQEIIKKSPSLTAAVHTVIEIFRKNVSPSFDASVFLDRAYVMENIYIGLQRTSAQELEKKDTEFEGIEQYLYVRSEDGTVKASKGYLERLDIEPDLAWELAKNHTFADIKIDNIMKILAELQGLPYDESLEELSPMFCVSNQYSTYGAAGILNRELLKVFAMIHGTNRLIILPSSIHDALIVTDDSITPEEATEMVMVVNGENVAEHEQLSDRAYVLEF